MKIIPAIDIKTGKVVRLAQGAPDKVTAYAVSPIDQALKFDSFGVEMIHIVDLDGAFEGALKNLGIVKDIVGKVRAHVELGGGIRDEKAIKECIDAGVSKVVIGTRAFEEKFVAKIVKAFNEKIVVGIDAKDGMVYTKGWAFKTRARASELTKKMRDLGVKTINYTDISRDGMLGGPNIESLKEILQVGGIDIIASGGISTIDDVSALKALEAKGLKGIIIGKALYENRIDITEAMAICESKTC